MMNPASPQDPARARATEKTRRRYDRTAPLFDLMDRSAERGAMPRWRRGLWSLVEGPRVLEVGVGTGASFPFYRPDLDITAIDLSPRMLERAKRRAQETGVKADLRLMDVQQLEFADETFDSVVTSCVFCSVPEPVAGFAELLRVLKPQGRGYFLEHVLSRRPVLKQVMRAANPMVVHMMGANIDRRTRANLEKAGFDVVEERDLWLDIVKVFVGRRPPSQR
jgi:ubiquinone/menaquinone biosynthesis C-methylase UbiE